MSQLFGEVAGAYHEARPGYPAEIVAAIRAYHGGTPELLAEVGAGTGLATATLLGLGAPTVCVEPDPRMAAVLAARFPQVDVVTAAFEEWTPPGAGRPEDWFPADIAGSGLFTTVDGFGGTVVLDLRTTLVLARRRAWPAPVGVSEWPGWRADPAEERSAGHRPTGALSAGAEVSACTGRP
ncbi:hypothetical protein [Micromonospora sp. NPDC005305]|uniref:class I SAM-dependent methyltransferase n=1 Tax=Micromonospora sp. NPDC005305 TaxID=3156875 RepID=UPI0033B098BA